MTRIDFKLTEEHLISFFFNSYTKDMNYYKNEVSVYFKYFTKNKRLLRSYYPFSSLFSLN